MSEDKFKKARGMLAHSQQLLDKVRTPQMDTQEPTPQKTPTEALQQQPQQTAPQEQPEAPQQGGGVAEMFQSFMQEMRGMFQQFFKEEQKTESKVDELLTTGQGQQPTDNTQNPIDKVIHQ